MTAINPEIQSVLMNIMMPEIDGYEVLRQIKQIESIKNIPVIFISALDSM
ncbi:MAG: response regulator [Gammaproteobacteria bacterium]|nr:response regulator [Gammaproteobacteria bacterium]